MLILFHRKIFEKTADQGFFGRKARFLRMSILGNDFNAKDLGEQLVAVDL
jgi:hypothetical protein